MAVLGKDIRLGMGCWAIGGPFWAGDQPLGWGEVDDARSTRAIHAALDAGIRYFDTASVYGCGRSERVLGHALSGRDAVVSTKFGVQFDERTLQVHGQCCAADQAVASVEASLRRLGREHIDMVFLHVNDATPQEARPALAAMETMRSRGKIGAFGWSTDVADSIADTAGMEGFEAVQFDMNLFKPAKKMRDLVRLRALRGVARQPLAMGLLTGKLRVDGEDVRVKCPDWLAWFKDGVAKPELVARLDAVRELLRSGGRSLAQGALGWIWAKDAGTVPIPGFRTEKQVCDNAGALNHGPLPGHVLDEIESILRA